MTRMCTCKVDIGLHGLIILTYMCSEQQWDKQYQITNQYLDRFSRNLYFVALEVGVSVHFDPKNMKIGICTQQPPMVNRS